MTASPTPTATTPSGRLYGSVRLERPGITPPDQSWEVDVVITLCDHDINVGEYSTTTGDEGYLTVDLPAGEYDIYVKNSHTLSSAPAHVTIPAGDTTELVEFGTLAEGDANDDNYVLSSDFFILKATYNMAEGDPGYDDRADFNEDQMVTSSDFFLMKNHYNQEGDSCPG
jgi:hypothetical protein